MIPEIGHYALILALVLAMVQGCVPLIGAAQADGRLMALGRQAAFGQLLFVATAFFALMHAYVVSDFSVLNVAQNSHTAKPMLYKVAGVWGNHEGSLVLWVLILALFGAGVAVFGRNLPETLRARVLSVQAMIGVGFLLFILLVSNPFLRVLPPPENGQGLNPLLQDPGLAFHPPFLYLGYVGFSTTFSFAVAALIEGRVDPAWARWVRPWALAAWCALTIGIAMGSWWAYYELGWGGFWFWDPVENASFMPWLAGTALLHSAIVTEKRDALKSWTVLLAILTFSLSLLGTFLVRSGVLTSVHAFAVDPARGVFVLGLLIVAIGGSLTLYAVRAPSLKGGGLFAPISRETGLVLNNWLLATAAATVLVGTLYPLLLDAMTGQKISVGPPFFNLTFVPLMVPLVLAMALGPMLAWKRADLAGLVGRLRFMLGLSAGAGLLAWALSGGPVLPVVSVALGIWLIVGVAADLGARAGAFRLPWPEVWRRAAGLPRATWGMSVAHAGFGIAILGIVANTSWTQSWQGLMKPGDRIRLGSYAFTLDGTEQVQGPNYTALRAKVDVRDMASFHGGNGAVMSLYPEQRTYPVPPMQTTEAAIRPRPTGDLYVVVGAPQDGGYPVRLYVKPLASWIWGGALIMAAGGILSLSDRRLRVGAPARRRRKAEAASADAQPARA